MAGRQLLDTNIVAALFNGDSHVRAQIDLAPEIFISSVTLGELFFGAAHSSRPEANSNRIEDLASASTIIAVDGETARLYGQIKCDLRRKGRPIPENDLWIAACAVQHGLCLVTRDRHFHQIENLVLESW